MLDYNNKIVINFELLSISDIVPLKVVIKMAKKNIIISGKEITIHGSDRDIYFNNYLSEGKQFYDTPIAFMEKYCREDAVVIDIGANIGLVTSSCAVLSPKGKIYAFEASPSIYKFLRKTVNENKFSNVKIFDIALSDKKRILKFYEDNKFLAGSRVVTNNYQNDKIIKVPAMPFDKIVKNLDLKKIDIIKLDVEGHELQVLKGAAKTIKKYQPHCLIEFNSYSMIWINRQLPQDFMKYLKTLFPRIYAFDRKNLGINEITENTDEFIISNLLNGCVDDLVCSFGDLPAPSKWFTSQQ